MTYRNDNSSSLRFVCANAGRLYWLLSIRSEHGWLMLVYGTGSRCRPWAQSQILEWRREWKLFPFFLVRLCMFIQTCHPASPNRLCRILFIRRIVQIWYKRKGDAEGEIIVSNPTTTGRCWIQARENGSNFDERKAGQSWRNQKENQLLFYSWSHPAIRWICSSHSTSAESYPPSAVGRHSSTNPEPYESKWREDTWREPNVASPAFS